MPYLSELKPINSKQISFQGKAIVLLNDDGDIEDLFSQYHHVARLKYNDDTHGWKLTLFDRDFTNIYGDVVSRGFDAYTTRRHINEFLMQHEMRKMSREEMERYVEMDISEEQDASV